MTTGGHVLLQTKFSKEGVFYGGEKLSCTFQLRHSGAPSEQPLFSASTAPKPRRTSLLQATTELAQRKATATLSNPEIQTSFIELNEKEDANEHGPSELVEELKEMEEKDTLLDHNEDTFYVRRASEIKHRLDESNRSQAGQGMLSWLWPFGGSVAEDEDSTAGSTESLTQFERPESAVALELKSPKKEPPPPMGDFQRSTLRPASKPHALARPPIYPGGRSATAGVHAVASHEPLTKTASLERSLSRASSIENQHVEQDQRRDHMSASQIALESVTAGGRRYSDVHTTHTSPLSAVYNKSFHFPQRPVHSNISVQTKFAHDGVAHFALGFVQLVGYYTVDPALVKLTPEAEESRRFLSHTSGVGSLISIAASKVIDSKAIPLYMTAPIILFGDLTLISGEEKTFHFETMLPSFLPPTHRGRALHLSYKLIFGYQRRITDKPDLIQLPFRVFSKVDESGYRPEYTMQLPVFLSGDGVRTFSNEDLLTANAEQQDVLDLIRRPGLVDQVEASRRQRKRSVVWDDPNYGKSMEHILLLIQQAKRLTFNICKNNINVGRLRIGRSIYRLGDIVHATLDFTEAEVSCFQFSAYLENHETIDPKAMAKPFSLESMQRFTRRILAEHHEFCLHTKRTNFSLSIPATSSPDFGTNFVSSMWQLRLEFITSSARRPLFQEAPSNGPPPRQLVGLGKSKPSQSGSEKQLEKDIATSADELAQVSLLSLSPNGTSQQQPQQMADVASHFYACNTVSTDSFTCSIPLTVHSTDCDSGRMYPSRCLFQL